MYGIDVVIIVIVVSVVIVVIDVVLTGNMYCYCVYDMFSSI